MVAADRVLPWAAAVAAGVAAYAVGLMRLDLLDLRLEAAPATT